VYLSAVGAAAIVAFIAAKPALAGYSRYTLLGLLAPVGISALLLTLDPLPLARRAVVMVVVAWAALMSVDHATVLTAYSRRPPPQPKRELADYLVAHGMITAAAGYWRAYEVTFLTGERVRLASTDVIRIAEYQQLFQEHPEAVTIADRPCERGSGETVGGMYICRP
jgi:hypothetical protein